MGNYINTAVSIDSIKNKTENNGVTSAGRLSAADFNLLTSAVEEVQDNLDELDEALQDLSEEVDGKQDALVSGTNVKTVNGQSLLGTGDIELESLEGIKPDMVAGASMSVLGSTTEVTFFSRSATHGQGTAVITGIKGNTFPVHQLWRMLDTQTRNGVTATNNGDGTYTMNGTGTAAGAIEHTAKVIAGHKYLYVLRYVSGSVSDTSIPILQQYSNPQLLGSNATRTHSQRDAYYVSTCNTSGTLTLRVCIRAITYTNYTFSPFYADLTAMFGAGNEPTTWDEYNAAIARHIGTLPAGYDGHDLASVKMTGLRSDGDTSIPVTTIASGGTVVFPDGMNRIGNDYDEIARQEGETVAIRRTAIVDLGDLSWGYNASNGIFYAKLDGTDSAAPYAADRTKACVVAYPYTLDTTSTATGDLADKSYRLYWWYWNGINIKDSDYSDAAAFKEAMAGVKLVYVLSTPATYEIDNFSLPAAYPVGTTEQVLPQNTQALSTCAPTLGVRYPKPFLGADDLSRFLTALGEAMGGTWGMAQDGEGNYSFTYTQDT